MSFPAGTYAKLTPDLLSVEDVRVMLSSFEADATRIRPIVMTSQPAFDSATQKVVQSGWSVLADQVNPVWQVVALTADELAVIQQETSFNQLDNWIATFEANTATAAQTQTAMARVLKELKRLRGTS